MIGVRRDRDELAFDLQLGVLVAATFVVFEVFLLPFFEYTRESLTIALVRYRIAKGKPITICPETSLPVALGLSDGLYGKSAFIAIPRALKIVFKVALISSVFAWEFHLDVVHRAQLVSLEFNAKGPRGPTTQSSVMFPLPIEGIPENTSTTTTVAFKMGPSGSKFPRNFSQSRVRRIDLQYSAHCVNMQESGRRVAYIGIYSHNKRGQRKIYCLNGTHSSEEVEVLSYDSERSSRYRVTSVSLQKISKSRFVYAANVNIVAKSGLASSHKGFLKVLPRKAPRITNFTRDIRSKKGTLQKLRLTKPRVVGFSVFGLLIHSSNGTILKLSQRAKPVRVAAISCKSKISQKGTLIPVQFSGVKCLKRYGKMQFLSFQFNGTGGPYVEDIDLHVKDSPTFKVGTPMNIIRAWMRTKATRKILQGGSNFTDDLWQTLSGEVFFFSEPKKKQLMLRVGDPKKRVRMKKWPTVGLLIVVPLFIAYSLACLVLKYQSRISTGIVSECVSRTALLEFIGRETSLKSTLLLDDLGSSTKFGLSLSGPTSQHLRLVSADKVDETPTMRFARFGERRNACRCRCLCSTNINTNSNT